MKNPLGDKDDTGTKHLDKSTCCIKDQEISGSAVKSILLLLERTQE